MENPLNILENLSNQEISVYAVSSLEGIKEYARKAKEIGIITNQEISNIIALLTDQMNKHDWSLFNDIVTDLKSKLIRRYIGNSNDMKDLFQFQVASTVIDVRPILNALEWEGVEGMAAVLDTCIFKYLDSSEGVEDNEKQDIHTLRQLRDGLLSAGKIIEMDTFRNRQGDKRPERANYGLSFVDYRLRA